MSKSIPMTQNGALVRATLLGFSMVVVGGCILSAMGSSFGFLPIIGLIVSLVTSFYKLVIMVMGMILVGVGALWMVKPQRALDTIDRNQK